MDRISVKKRKELMAKVKNKDTDIELMLGAALCTSGIKFSKNFSLLGKPDIVILENKIAVFCDGDFWHGKNYKKEKDSYNDFWKEKIKANIDRDRKVNKELKKEGWKVLRFWETDIYSDPGYCVAKIREHSV